MYLSLLFDTHLAYAVCIFHLVRSPVFVQSFWQERAARMDWIAPQYYDLMSASGSAHSGVSGHN